MPTQVKSASPSCVSSLQDELDNKRPSLSSKWETFAANTTLHGLRNVVEDNRSKIRRTIWIIFLRGSTGYYFYFVFLCISKFNELPVQMIISQESTLLSGMDFPAVTICNLNQVMKSKLDMADDDKRFTEMGLNITGCHETRAIRGNLTCGRALRCVFSEQDEETGCDGTTRGKLSKAFNQTSFNMEEFYTNYGHDLEGLTSQFRYCVFEKRKNCSAKDFVPSITKDGICYTFNTGQNNAKLFRSKFEGPELGLNILLDVQTDEATFDLFGDLSSGLKVIIHDRKTLVNRFGGFNVMPGTQAMVGVKLINVSFI